ncbi:MAG: winged helix-turn-helix domain-containing protein [Oscillospiraceae bacterium]|nr:winged helix-turn-helix domain-containing protein [Oscillospiraceae bacterium]MCL2279831.1 winged helix-turn-helix domain-containing protein [Oscillospiraceae bacterium]
MTKSRVRVRVEMFGEFAIIGNNNRITENARKSSKVWRLLQYLVYHRDRAIPQEELLEVLCEDYSGTNNPGSVLRTMIYRARGALEKGGIENASSILVAKSGGYSWNTNIECTTDTGEFEELIKKANLPGTDDEAKLDLLLKATALYKGNFLPNGASDMWVMPLIRWYRTMYLKAVNDALQLLNEKERSAEAIALCTKALGIDPFDVKLIEHQIRALLKQNRNAEALDFYKRMETMFFDILGVNFSDNLRELYSEIRQPDIEVTAPLEDILADWGQGADFPGAYYVDASVFKIIYQIEARSKPRSGRSTFLVRFDTNHVPKGNKISGVMHQLGRAVQNHIRMGDLFTRYSPGQYMVMLYSLTYEDCKMIIGRILRAVDSRYLADIKASHVTLIGEINGKPH